jgi:hypothetical protein
MAFRIWITVGLSMATGALGGFFLASGQDSRERTAPRTWEPPQVSSLLQLPAFPWKVLSSPHARKANLWTTADGRLSRYSVVVDKAALPDWVPAMADARLGRGPDLECEIELYPDGSEVYEIYRKIDGRERQLSVKADRSLYYVGTEQDPGKLPDAVAAAIRGLKDVVVEHCLLKEGPQVAEYHLRASVEKAPCRIRVSKDGALLAVQRKIPGEVEVPLKP